MAERPTTEHVAIGIAGITILAAVIVLWIELLGNPALHVPRGRDPGPAFQPQVLLVVLGACALWMIFSAVLNSVGVVTRRDLSAAAKTSGRQMIVPLAMVITLIGFVILAPALGFLPVSLVFTIGWASWITWRDHENRSMRGFSIATAGAIAVTLAVFYVFARIIGVPL